MTFKQISVKLFNHQILSIKDMEERENKRKVVYNHVISNESQPELRDRLSYLSPFKNAGKYTINTNFSILGNDPGSGKTLITLGLIAGDITLFCSII